VWRKRLSYNGQEIATDQVAEVRRVTDTAEPNKYSTDIVFKESMAGRRTQSFFDRIRWICQQMAAYRKGTHHPPEWETIEGGLLATPRTQFTGHICQAVVCCCIQSGTALLCHHRHSAD
jgi:hypothetical protein